jgi:hypothetical protein
MAKGLLRLSALAVAGTALPGCVAVAIPALAGSAMVGNEVIPRGEAAEAAPAAAAPAAELAEPATSVPPAVPAPAQESDAPGPPSAAPLPATPPAPAPLQSALLQSAPVRSVPAPAPALVSLVAIPAYPDPAMPIGEEHVGFARFVRYGLASAQGASESADLLSAILSDPVALDGRRRRCGPGEQQVALIDLDPAGGLFAPPDAPAPRPGLALGLSLLREAGVEIAWISDLPTIQSGPLRSAIERSGLDPRGQDIVSLRRDETDTKQKRRDSLAGIACIVAIAGDERTDFDERFKYLRNPEAGAPLEPLIGDGWFLIAPLLGKEGQ